LHQVGASSLLNTTVYSRQCVINNMGFKFDINILYYRKPGVSRHMPGYIVSRLYK